MDWRNGTSSSRIPDYRAVARELEALSRQAAEQAAATGDRKLDAVAARLVRHAEEIRCDLDGSGARRCGWRLGLLNL